MKGDCKRGPVNGYHRNDIVMSSTASWSSVSVTVSPGRRPPLGQDEVNHEKVLARETGRGTDEFQMTSGL